MGIGCNEPFAYRKGLAAFTIHLKILVGNRESQLCGGCFCILRGVSTRTVRIKPHRAGTASPLH